MKNYFLYILCFVFIAFISCNKGNVYSSSQSNTAKQISDSSSSKLTVNLTEDQKKVLEGAKKCLEQQFSYDLSMAYHTLTYEDGVNTGRKVFPNGDLDPSTGVCTDVIVRALRFGNVVDLQEALNSDVSKNFSIYPMKRWGAKKPDSNIDHRRVPNLEVWLAKNWKKLDNNICEPGDIVVWDMNQDGWGDHIGIVSDKFVNGNHYVIHNFPSPGFVAEEDILNRWKIIGQYRINKQ